MNKIVALNNIHFLQVLQRVWNIMRHPRYCVAHHPGISFNTINATHFSAPPMSPTLAQQPYSHLHTTHVTHAGTSPTLVRQPRNSR